MYQPGMYAPGMMHGVGGMGTPIPPPGVANAMAAATSTPVGAGVGSMVAPIPATTRTNSVMYGAGMRF